MRIHLLEKQEKTIYTIFALKGAEINNTIPSF